MAHIQKFVKRLQAIEPKTRDTVDLMLCLNEIETRLSALEYGLKIKQDGDEIKFSDLLRIVDILRKERDGK